MSYLAVAGLTLVGWLAFNQRSQVRRLDSRRRRAERRERAELELRKKVRASEEHFRFLVESVEDYASFMLGLDGRVVSWNAGAERLLGYRESEVLGQHVSIFYSPEDRLSDHWDEVLQRTGLESRYREEGWRVRKDGTSIWATVILQPMYEGADPIGFIKVVHDLTEQKEVGERVKRILESITDAFFTLDREWRFTYVNRRAEEFLGRRRGELLGRSIWEEFPEAMGTAFEEAYQRVLQERATVEVETYFAPTDRWIEVRAYPSEEGLSVYFHDITERRRAEDSLRVLVEAGTTLAASLDYRETLARLARLAVPVLADWSVLDVLEADEVKRIEVAVADPAMAEAADRYREYPPKLSAPHSPVARALRTGRPELITEVTPGILERMARNSDHVRMALELGVHSIIVVPLLARGQTLGALSLVMSRSGRRFGPDDLAFAIELAGRAALVVDNVRLFEQAREAHLEAERRAREEEALRLATAAVGAAFTIEEMVDRIAQNALAATNADGTLVEWVDSERCEVEVVAVAGNQVLALGARMASTGSLAQAVIERGDAICIDRLSEARDRLSSGLLRTCADCAVLAVPLADAGEVFGALILLREPQHGQFRPDEVERARTFADLAALAFRKVHVLEESERRRAELVQVMDSRSRLMRGFSHDVKNPLGAADGFLQLLEDGILGELQDRQREGVQRARRALGTAFRLIQELLELARAEAGDIAIERHPVDLGAVVHETLEEYRARAEAKGLLTEVELPTEFPLVECDASRVRQILGNLLSNAIKYTPKGAVRVQVSCQSEGPAPGIGCWAAIAIIDSGPGIPESEQCHLFQEFRRLNSGEDSEGAGVGLAISRRIALALGGDITVESMAGRGSTFTLWLPVQESESDEPAPAASVD